MGGFAWLQPWTGANQFPTTAGPNENDPVAAVRTGSYYQVSTIDHIINNIYFINVSRSVKSKYLRLKKNMCSQKLKFECVWINFPICWKIALRIYWFIRWHFRIRIPFYPLSFLRSSCANIGSSSIPKGTPTPSMAHINAITGILYY